LRSAAFELRLQDMETRIKKQEKIFEYFQTNFNGDKELPYNDYLLLHKHHQKLFNQKPKMAKSKSGKVQSFNSKETNSEFPVNPKFLFDYLQWKITNLTNKKNNPSYQFDITNEYLHWKSKIESETEPDDYSSDKTSSSESTN